MVDELETVVLTHDIPDHGLRNGDVGAVVHKYADGSEFEVEFLTADGNTIAVLTLVSTDIRKFQPGEILHVREISSA